MSRSRSRYVVRLAAAVSLAGCAGLDASDADVGGDDALDAVDVGSSGAELSLPPTGVETLVTSLATAPSIPNFGCWNAPTSGVPFLGQVPCHGRSNQQFFFDTWANGYRIRAATNVSLCLTAGSAGAQAAFLPCDPNSAQTWIVLPINSEKSTIRPAATPALCLAEDGPAAGSTTIRLASCNNALAQQWKFHRLVSTFTESCQTDVRFLDPTVPPGGSAAFRRGAGTFTVVCAPTRKQSITCDAGTDLWVVDRLSGPGSYTVRCFHGDPGFP